jgi:IclR family transcriptional regulator, acetate operon repressor
VNGKDCKAVAQSPSEATRTPARSHRAASPTGTPAVDRAASPTGTQAVDRAAALLVRVLESTVPQSFGSLTDDSDLPKSTASRLLNALERHGMLERDRQGLFRPGPAVVSYARRVRTSDDLVAVAQPFLDTLGRCTGETINLAVPGRDLVDQVAQVDSRYMLGVTNWVGLAVPYHCSAVGKVFLAFDVATLPKGRLEQCAPRTLTTREQLARDLEISRVRGYAVADEELEPGLVAIAAPVHRADGAVVAALSVSGPSVRLDPARIEQVANLLVDEARGMSAVLGHSSIGYKGEGYQPRKEGAA